MGYWNVNKVSLETLIETGLSSVTGYEPWLLVPYVGSLIV